VLLVAFTFDLDDVVQAILEAKRRAPDIDVRVLIDKDQGLNGQTRNLRPRVLQLTSRSIPVRLFGRSRLHAKVLLTDAGQMWGSLNWTNASLLNIERSTATSLAPNRLNDEKRWFESLWSDSRARDFPTEQTAAPPKLQTTA